MIAEMIDGKIRHREEKYVYENSTDEEKLNFFMEFRLRDVLFFEDGMSSSGILCGVKYDEDEKILFLDEENREFNSVMEF